jgi:hypothetical protein
MGAMKMRQRLFAFLIPKFVRRTVRIGQSDANVVSHRAYRYLLSFELTRTL